VEPLNRTLLPAGSPAAELAAAIAAWQPLNVSPERQARVLAAVLDRPRRLRRSRFGLLRPAAALLAVFALGVATAVAMVAPGLRAPGWRWGAGERAAASLPVVRPRVRPAAPSPEAPEPPAARPPPEARPAHGRARAAAPDDPSRLMAAVQALRRDRQPARAQRLALAYLRASPRGALAEEALAVGIQAAASTHDPQAARLAGRYLWLYPAGRFRRVAEEALAQALDAPPRPPGFTAR
jgi:hypothetical protein